MNCPLCDTEDMMMFPDAEGDKSIGYCKKCGKIFKTKEENEASKI